MLVSSPIGPVTVVARDGAVVAVWMNAGPGADVGVPDDGASDVLAVAAGQLAAYFAGERHDFDFPMEPEGSDFQRRVWAALREIPYGQTESYGELAARIGLDPRTSSRAVGAANGRNPLGIVVPCHRVIGADGSLTGYAGGLPAKRFLLEHESAHAPAAADRLF